MKRLTSDPTSAELDGRLTDLVETIRRNHPESGGEYRAARAELDARLAVAQAAYARGLVRVTWVLALATVGLLVATVVLVFVTASE